VSGLLGALEDDSGAMLLGERFGQGIRQQLGELAARIGDGS
jgi:hypothetical protein